VGRIDEYFHDLNPPPVQDLVVVIFAVVRDRRGRVLLVRRVDDGNWELPGGRVEVGETASGTVLREVEEESGVRIAITGVSGIYSDPAHIVVYLVEGARQQVAICVHARPEPAEQTPRPDHDETSDAAWFTPADTRELAMQADVRRRLDHALEDPAGVHID
jgi:8-oxo-dGTP pyrophosphatase MutT (NUDIX family)